MKERMDPELRRYAIRAPFSPWILKGSQLVLPLAFPFVPTPGVAVTKEQTGGADGSGLHPEGPAGEGTGFAVLPRRRVWLPGGAPS